MPPQKWNKPDDILKPLDDRAVDAINNNFDAVFRLLRDSPIGRGRLPVASGGTNQDTFGTGELLYAASPTLIDGLPDVATGNVLLSGGVGAVPSYGKVSLNGSPIHVTGTLQVAHGGTGLATVAQGDLLYASALDTLSALPKSTASTRYLSNTGSSNSPAWAQVSLTTGVTGVLPEANGGTNQSTYTTGDLLYASASNTLSKLADVATGNALISGGVGAAPSWGKVGLTTHVSGTLAVGNGGTGIASFSQGDLLYASASATLTALPKSASSTRYLSNTGTTNNPAWAQVDLTNGVTGTLPVTSGGTGLSSLSQGDLLYASAANTLSALTKNTTSTRYLTNQGSSNNPSWGQVDLSTGITGTLTVSNGGTGVVGIAQGDLIYGAAVNTFSVLVKSASATRYLSNTGTSNNPAWAQVNLANGVSGTLAQANGGTGTTDGSLTTTGGVDAKNCRGTGVNAFGSGAGCEIGYNGSAGFMQAYNYTGAAYIPFLILGSTHGICIGATQVAGWDASGHFTPTTDNTYNNGDASHRWKLVRGVTITSGDLQFENRWTITEGDKIGLAAPRGLAFLDERDELVAFLARGVLYVNETRPLKELPWKKTTHAQRTRSIPSSTSASSAHSAL